MVLILVLTVPVWCCVVKHGLVTLVIVMILKDTTTFQVLFIVSLFWSWNITTVKINSCVHLKVKSPPSAFVYFRWSCYFGLGLKNLVLFTSLPRTPVRRSHRSPRCHSWWGRGLLPLPKNPTPAVGLRLRFSALRVSFSSLPNSLHSP